FLTSVINLGQLELDCQAIHRCVSKAKLISESLNKVLKKQQTDRIAGNIVGINCVTDLGISQECIDDDENEQRF
ncbi:MAG: hypothetical protein KKF79_12155, partial [Gammaproteobacteria bacterium]|nr:hypothetical protein [Gammaproteobacteria bacterium]